MGGHIDQACAVVADVEIPGHTATSAVSTGKSHVKTTKGVVKDTGTTIEDTGKAASGQ